MTAVLYGVTATVAVGFTGLATEGGSWYLTRRDAQNAADAAAYVGAVRLTYTADALSYTLANQRSNADAASRDTATRNGFTQGQDATRVIVNIPPASGALAGSPRAVEVIVQRDRERLMSRVFLAAGLQQIAARGVAATQNNGPACLLGGVATPTPAVGVTVWGNADVQTPNCVTASNATGDNAIEVGNSAVLNALAIVSAGGCSNCSGNVTTRALPTTNPFAYLDTKVLPTFTNASCINSNSGPIPRNGTINASMTLNPPPVGQAICGFDVSGAATVVTLTPGTYYFFNASFGVSSGTVRCPACTPSNGITMVFTGNNARGPDIRGGTVELVAGSASDPDYAGILFFRDPRSPGGNQGNPPAEINGNATTTLTGGMYFPGAYVKYSGTSGTTPCSILVAGTIEATGNSGLDSSGCVGLGLGGITPQTQIVRLVE